MAETQLAAYMAQRQPSSDVFLKSSNSQPISSEHDVIHTPAPFSAWVLLWQWWLTYPLRTSVKLYPNDSTPRLPTRKVQSQTKLNDKISLCSNSSSSVHLFIFLYPIGYQSAQFFRRALHYASGGRQFFHQSAQSP